MFSEKIKELRNIHNMTQEDLANKLYVTRNAVSKWETGKGLPSVETLMDIAKIFKVTIDELLNEKDAKAALNEVSIKVRRTNDSLRGVLIFFIYAIASTLLPFICFTLNPASVAEYLLFYAPVSHILAAIIAFMISKTPFITLISAALGIIPSYIYFDLGTNTRIGFWEIISFVLFVLTYLLLFKLNKIKNIKTLKIIRFISLISWLMNSLLYLVLIIYQTITYSKGWSISILQVIHIYSVVLFLPIALSLSLFILFTKKLKKELN